MNMHGQTLKNASVFIAAASVTKTSENALLTLLEVMVSL